MFKWLNAKIDAFSVSGVKIDTLENIYTKTKDLLISDKDNPQNQMILSIVQKFMRAVNARREDFEFNNLNEEAKEESDEELKEDNYNSSKSKDQTPVKKSPEKSQLVSMSSPLALKNNYMSPKEAVEDERVELTHPLKSQLIGCFSEMASSKAKYQIIRPLSY